MGKAKSQSVSAVDTEQSVELLTPIELGDTLQVRQELDETICSTLCDDMNLTQDDSLENFKMLMMVIACAFAMTAQFSPIPFPDSRMLLGFCCASYFICSGILQFVTTFIQKGE